METAMNNLRSTIQKYAHTTRKCYIVGFSLGGVTALCFLRNQPEFVEERVAKIFVSSPRLEAPRYGTLIVMIAIPLLRFYLFLNSFESIREVLERWTGLKISDELARDMTRWAAWSRLFRAAQNVPRPDVVDNIKEKVDLELMLCMASKEPVERILRVEEVMKEKVTCCQAVIALNQVHLYVP